MWDKGSGVGRCSAKSTEGTLCKRSPSYGGIWRGREMVLGAWQVGSWFKQEGCIQEERTETWRSKEKELNAEEPRESQEVEDESHLTSSNCFTNGNPSVYAGLEWGWEIIVLTSWKTKFTLHFFLLYPCEWKPAEVIVQQTTSLGNITSCQGCGFSLSTPPTTCLQQAVRVISSRLIVLLVQNCTPSPYSHCPPQQSLF